MWYEPVWDGQWQTWGPVSTRSILKALKETSEPVAGVVVTSPTYAGALSEIAAIAESLAGSPTLLIVDEAHGAHLLPGTSMPPSALTSGADIVVHSLHKTLGSLTQTGLLHVCPTGKSNESELRAALRLLSSSSPSYLLLASIEDCLTDLTANGQAKLDQLLDLAQTLVEKLSALESIELYGAGENQVDPLHVLMRPQLKEADTPTTRAALNSQLYEYLYAHGVIPEAIIGAGTLLLLGTGSTIDDISILVAALQEFDRGAGEPAFIDQLSAESPGRYPFRPPEITQVISPRQAMISPAEVVPLTGAAGRIAAEVVAPCPPGVALVVPGQLVPLQLPDLVTLNSLRVVVE